MKSAHPNNHYPSSKAERIPFSENLAHTASDTWFDPLNLFRSEYAQIRENVSWETRKKSVEEEEKTK